MLPFTSDHLYRVRWVRCCLSEFAQSWEPSFPVCKGGSRHPPVWSNLHSSLLRLRLLCNRWHWVARIHTPGENSLSQGAWWLRRQRPHNHEIILRSAPIDESSLQWGQPLSGMAGTDDTPLNDDNFDVDCLAGWGQYQGTSNQPVNQGNLEFQKYTGGSQRVHRFHHAYFGQTWQNLLRRSRCVRFSCCCTGPVCGPCLVFPMSQKRELSDQHPPRLPLCLVKLASQAAPEARLGHDPTPNKTMCCRSKHRDVIAAASLTKVVSGLFVCDLAWV